MRVRVVVIPLAVVCCACQSKGRAGQAPSGRPNDSAIVGSSRGATPPAAPAAGIGRPKARKPDSVGIGETSNLSSFDQILALPGIVGRRVTLQGRCFGYGRTGALGAPPVTRSDWAFGDSVARVYVVGAPPSGCEGVSAPAQGIPILLTGIVAEDTLTSMFGRTLKVRRYLRRVQ